MYYPVDPRGNRLTVGLRTLDLATWFEFDENFDAEIAVKFELDKSGADVFALTPEGEDGVAEFLELAEENLQQFHPTRFTESNSLIDFSKTVQEDICIMSNIDGKWVLTAAVLYAPSRWRLFDKIGKDLEGIHGPVPGYQPQIGKAVEVTFDKLTTDRSVWRANWTLLDDDTRFQPAPPTPENQLKISGANLDEQIFFRVERQTLRKMPRTGDIVFTIRTYVTPLGELLKQIDSPSAMLEAIRTMESEHVEYKGWKTLKPALIAHLERDI
ncbi:MAG: hypothetical protein RLZZ330_705 [Actinomycetota bacterium]|jgi:hypothetical protein